MLGGYTLFGELNVPIPCKETKVTVYSQFVREHCEPKY